MKLHLPKQLFTALLAAITFMAPAALTLGSAAWGVVEDADSTKWSGEEDTWYVTSGNAALNAIDASTIDKTTVFIRATKEEVDRTVTTLTLKNTDSLIIAGDWDSETAYFDTLTIESLVIGSAEEPGSANLTVGAAQTNHNATPAQTVTINSITGSVGNLTLGNASTLTINDSVSFIAGSTLALNANSNLVLNDAGTITLRNESNNSNYLKATGTGTITIGSGTTVDLANTSRPGATGAIEGSVVVLGGGKLKLSGDSASLLGYNEGTSTDATDNVYLRGDSAASMATMEITSTKNQHLSTNLYLQGYAQVTGATGIIETYNGKITATGTENNIESKINVNRDLTVEITGADDTLELKGYVYGIKMTKTGAGTLTFSNTGSDKNSLQTYIHQSGVTVLDTEFTFTKELKIEAGEVQVQGNAKVSGDLNIAGGTLILQSDGRLILTSGATLSSDLSLAGTGTLRLEGAYNKTGSINFTSGVTELSNFSKTGDATLTLGATNLSGIIRMNYDGGAVNFASIGSVAADTVLMYCDGSKSLDIGNLNQNVTLNVFNVVEQLNTGVNLGFSRGAKDLDEIKGMLSLKGLTGSYSLEERDDYVYMIASETLTCMWDSNWGVENQSTNYTLVTDSRADLVREFSQADAGPHYYHIKDEFVNEETVSVVLNDTADYSATDVIVGGFATSTNANSQGTVARNVWIRANSGSYHGIIGGNLSNNWDGGNAANFEGDTHILVDGATVGVIIGGNFRDGKNPQFTGNTYISVMDGNVTGAIIGAGAHAHNGSIAFNGNTDIHVYVPLDQAGGRYLSSSTNLNVVAGGASKITNSSGTTNFTGNTSVTVDLSSYAGERTSFAKVVAGGHYSNQAGHTQNITGNTCVNIIGKKGVTFSQAIVGGSYNSGGAITHTGDSELEISGNSTFSGIIVGGNYNAGSGVSTLVNSSVTINGGSFSNSIVGGTYTTNVSSNTVGNSRVTINGGSFTTTSPGGNGHNPYNHLIVGGSMLNANNDGTSFSSTSTSVTITGGSIGMDIYGGHVDLISQSGGYAFTGTLDTATVTLNGATAVVNNIYGGSFTQRDNKNTNFSLTQGNVVVDLIAGTVNGSVYAGGRQIHKSNITTATTEVRISDGVVFSSASAIVSGGYQMGCTSDTTNAGQNPSVVTGSKTLVFNGASQDRSGITFDSFDTIQVTNKDAAVTLGNLTNFTSLNKTGAGTLTLSGANTYSGGTTITGGKLVISSAGAVGSGTVTVNEGATLEMQAMPNDWTAASLLNGKVEGSGTLLISSSGWITGAVDYSTGFTGTLELAEGKNFTFGGTGDGEDGKDVNTKSISKFVLNSNSLLQYQGTGTNAQFKNLYVKGSSGAATLKLIDTRAEEADTVRLAGVTQLDNNLNLQAAYGGRISIEQLSGAGTLTSSGASSTSEAFYTTINSLKSFTGKLDFTDTSMHHVLVKTGEEGTVKFNSLSAEESTNGSFRFEVGTATNVNTLNIASGSVSIAEGASLSLLGAAQQSSSIDALGGAGDFLNVGGDTTIGTLSGFSGSLEVQAGSLVVNTYNASKTISVALDKNGALSMGSVHVNVADHGLTAVGSATQDYVDGSIEGNGYLQTTGKYVLFDGFVWNGSVTGFSTETDTTANKTYLTQNGEKGTVFYVNGETETYNTEDSSLHISSDYTTGIILNGGNLNMLTSLNQDATEGITAQKNATITLGIDAQLNEGDLTITSGTVTLTGSGTYKLASGSTAMTAGVTLDSVTLDSPWTGTVVMHGVTGIQNQLNTILNGLTNGTSSKVQLSGVNAWLSTQSTDRLILLENLGNGTAALTLNNGSTYGGGTKTAEFAGSVGGSGDIVFSWNTDSSVTTQRHLFSGDTSTWSGKFINENSNTMAMLVEFDRQGAVFSSTVDGGGIVNKNAATTAAGKTGGKLTVKFNNSGNIDFYGTVSKTEGASETEIEVAQGKVTLHKQVTVDGATVAQNATAKVNSTLTAGTVSNAGQIKLGEAATVTGGSMSKVQMSSAGISSSDETGSTRGALSNADVQIAQLAQDASFTIQDMTLTNTTVTAADVNNVRFDNVTVEGRTVLKMQAAMQMPSAVGMGGTAVNFETSSYSGITLNTAVTGNTLAVDLGDLSCLTPLGPDTEYELSITLNGLQFSTDYAAMAEGTGVLFTQDSWLGKLLEGQGATQFVADSETGAPVGSGGGGVSVSYSAATGDNVGTIITITGLNVPEPTTATLSLLALAALAARRRRQA